MSVKRSTWSLVIGFVASLAVSLQIHAEQVAQLPDQIVLKNGSTVLGKVTGSRDGKVSIDTDFAGTLSISLDKIESMQTRESVVIQLADETVMPDQPLLIEKEQLVVATETSQQQNFALNELRLVNPEPWELGRGYKWSGLVSLALQSERGNSDTDELDFKADSVWRSTRDRYTVGFSAEIDETNGEKSTDQWQAKGKYDYFLSGPNYLGVQLLAEYDKFTDLDLRYIVGPFIGRQFYDQPIFRLSGELGASYVDEDFKIAQDQDYASANWVLNASSNYLGGNSRLYFDNMGVWNLDETSDLIVNTTFGLAFPLLWNLEAAAEILLEYDSGAVEGVDDLDQTYKFRVGYTW